MNGVYRDSIIMMIIPDPCHVSSITSVQRLYFIKLDNAPPSCSSDGAMLTIVLLVSVVMIDVVRTASRAALIMSFTALGKGWSDMSATTPPERRPQTIAKYGCTVKLLYLSYNLLSCHDAASENVLNDSKHTETVSLS